MISNSKRNPTPKAPAKVARAPAKQVTQPKKKGNPTSQVQKAANNLHLSNLIALYLSAPGEQNVKSVRMSTDFAQQDTALAEPFRIVKSSFGSTPVTANLNMINNDQFLAFLFRGVECAAIIYDQNPAGSNYTYTAGVVQEDGSVEFGALVEALTFYTVTIPPEDVYKFKIPYLVPVQAYAPHGDRLYSGAVKGSTGRFFWVDEDAIITINAGEGVTGNVSYYLDKYDQFGLIEKWKEIPVSYAGGSAILSTLKADTDPAAYYAVSVLNKEETPLDLIINDIAMGGTCSVFCHLSLPDLDSNLQRELGVRVNALSMMYSNTSSIEGLGGTISGFQFGQKTDWFDLIVADPLTEIQSKKGSHTTDIRKGMFGFLKPTKPQDFDLISYTELDKSGNLVDSYYPLDDRGSFLAMAGAVPIGSGGNAGYFTLRYGIEYLSADTWAELKPAEVDEEIYHTALSMLKKIPQFHENSTHLNNLWNSITSGIGKAVNFGTKTLPDLMKLGDMVGSLIGGL